MDRAEWGRKVIEKALYYADYEWYATEANVYHGIDFMGRHVDTPDVTWTGEELDCGWWMPNQVNKGIPYCWGKGSTIEEFEQGLKEGKYAGNVPEDLTLLGSHACVGVDCSGLLTVCWDLPQKIATKHIPQYADKLERLEDLQQGDILAIPGIHVMLFKEFKDPEMKEIVIVDATRSVAKVSERTFATEELLNEGYELYRKKEI